MDLTSADPFWPLQDGAPAVYPPLQEGLNCDVLILGGGITGAFIAHHLVREGLDVVLLDKRGIGRGSTAGSTALLEYEIDTSLTDLAKMIGQREAEDAYRICRDSIWKIETIVRDLKDSCGFRRKKSAYLASRRRDAELLREECAARQKAGIAVEYLDERALRSMFSFKRPAALLSHDAAEVDPYRLTHQLLAEAAERGLRVFEHRGGETSCQRGRHHDRDRSWLQSDRPARRLRDRV